MQCTHNDTLIEAQVGSNLIDYIYYFINSSMNEATTTNGCLIATITISLTFTFTARTVFANIVEVVA